MDIKEFAEEMIKEGNIFGTISRTLFRKGLKGGKASRLGTRFKNYAKRAIVGRRGMLGSGMRDKTKELVKNPVSAVKRGWKDMDRSEKMIGSAIGALNLHSATGKLEKGETRLGRIGGAVGSTVGIIATPFKRVGALGNLLADTVGTSVGQRAGRLASKVTGVGGAKNKKMINGAISAGVRKENRW